MKLRNKIIIPSAITSIFAAITPTVLVSCANTKMVTTDIKTFDPTSVKSVPGTIGASTSIAWSKYYAERIANDSHVFINDIFYAESMYYRSLVNELHCQIPKYDIGISENITIGKVDYWHGGYFYSFPTLSFSYTWDTSISYATIEGDTKTEHQIISKQSVTYNNLPLVVYADPDDGDQWMVTSLPLDSDYLYHLMFLNNWSIRTDISYHQTNTKVRTDGTRYLDWEENIDTDVKIDSYYDFIRIREAIQSEYDNWEMYFKLFTGSYQFDSKNMFGVKP